MRITVNDIRAAGHCSRGIKNWFDAQGLDFRDFLKNGIAVEDFLASGDGQARQVVERKIARDLAGIDLSGVMITRADVAAAMKCSAGTRSFFAAYGLDYADFLENGIPAQVVWDTGDFEARMVVRHKVGSNG